MQHSPEQLEAVVWREAPTRFSYTTSGNEAALKLLFTASTLTPVL